MNKSLLRLNLWMLRWLSPVITSAGLIALIVGLILHVLGWRVSDFILGVTGLILIAYTLETLGMRQQMIRQYEIELHPLVIVTTQPTQDLVLKNIGRSAAISIQIEPLAFKPVPAAIDHIQVACEIIASFHLLDCLDTREEKLVSYSCHIEGSGGIKEPFQNNLKLVPHISQHATRNYCMTIHYEDIDGNPHKSLMQMGKDGTKLLSHT